MNSAALSIHEQVFKYSNSFGNIMRIGIAGSYSDSIFNFLRNS